MSIFTLTTGQSSDVRPHGAIGLVSETAPDGRVRVKFPNAAGFSDLFGDRSEARRRASDLARRLVANEPLIRGVRQLGVFEEVLIGELEPAFLALKLVDWLETRGVSCCQLNEESWLSNILPTLADEDAIVLGALPLSKGDDDKHLLWGRVCRVVKRLRLSRFSRAVLNHEWRQFLDHIDPFHRRPGHRRWRRDWRQGDVWFYSTAHTFTNIGVAYEPYFPAPFHFLVENPARGGAPLKTLSRPWTSIYDFSSRSFAPSSAEVENAVALVDTHLRSLPLDGSDARARDLVLSCKFYADFRQRLLALGLFHTRLFEEWIAEVRPAALVVGNFVFEAYALLAARKAGIPTVLLQHGTIGADTEASDPPVDYYLVRGRFWQKLLPEKAFKKSKVLNVPDESNVPRHTHERRTALLFLTAPYSMQKFWSESDLDDILAALLHCAAERGTELIVRVHPLETVWFYRDRIEKLMMGDEGTPSITYSQGGSLDAVLARSAVAVTYFSTVFVECLRWRVPIVSFDWHDFGYKEKIREHGVFHFAESLSELRELLSCALSGGLVPFCDGIEPFLAPTSEEELRREIGAMLKPEDFVIVRRSEQMPDTVAGPNA
jgi:hypothetical protein